MLKVVAGKLVSQNQERCLFLAIISMEELNRCWCAIGYCCFDIACIVFLFLVLASLSVPFFNSRHEYREALKMRFEIKCRLRQERKEQKRRRKKEMQKSQQRLLRSKERKQDSASRAIDELRAKR